MATSRTGTGRWKNIRAQRIALSIEQGITRCPLCNVHLDYEYSGHSASAEVDHIIAHARGGKDTLDNTRTICRKCNARLGSKLGAQTTNTAKRQPKPLKTSRRW